MSGTYLAGGGVASQRRATPPCQVISGYVSLTFSPGIITIMIGIVFGDTLTGFGDFWSPLSKVLVKQ